MSKKKIYDLVFSDWDGHSSYQFVHPNNKLRMEFEQDVQDTLRKYCEGYIENGENFSHEDFKTYIGTSDLVRMVSEHLGELGYVKLKDTYEEITFLISGSSIIQKEDARYDEQIRQLLGEECTKKVFKHNQELKNKYK